MTNPTFSRRSFSKLMGVSAAYAAVGLAIAKSPGPASEVKGSLFPAVPSSAAHVVRLSSNENPYGPSASALKAMTEGFSLAWRYPDEYADMLAEELARRHNVPVDQILLGDGSGEILKLCAAAFTNKAKQIVIGNPTFEAVARHAAVANAEVVKINLTPDYHHDLEGMSAGANRGGNDAGTNPA